ncbi:MAG: hypothetical protein C0600_16465 [Ignavibacteria bacterium]|nr:MAG: hypothetical protein C0600_16465 [Ignavibacteria bacterium]
MNRALLRSGLRYHRRHPLQAALLVLGVALGVAVVVGIDIANVSADRSFRSSTNSLTGAATHQIIGNAQGIPDSVFFRLRSEEGVRPSAPVIEGIVQTDREGGRTLRLLGIDPFSEAPFRSYVAEGVDFTVLQRLLTQPHTILLSADLAKDLQLNAGDTLALTRPPLRFAAVVAGILQPEEEFTRRSLGGMLVTDIASAQEMLGMQGYLSRIDLLLDGAATHDAPEIEAMLPAGLLLQRPESRSSAIMSMTDAFSLNLTALSLLALIVGMFLIYDTVSFSVVRRREQFGILRAIGASRKQIAAMVLTETAVLATVGSAAGLILGILLGYGALNMVSQTISDLYTTMTVTDVTVSAGSLAKGIFLGIGASLLAAMAPAREAMSSNPAGVMRRMGLEDRLQHILPALTMTGLGLLVLSSLLLLLPHKRVDLSFASVLLFLLGVSLLIPATLRIVMRRSLPLLRFLFGTIGAMAARSISRALSRTTVAIAALMIAVSVIVGVNTMIGSFRHTVVNWLSTTLGADVFVTIPFTGAGQNEGTDVALEQRILSHPDVSRTATARTLSLISDRYGMHQLVAVSDDIASERPYKWTRDGAENTWEALRNGAVLLSEPFAYRNGIPAEPGQSVSLHTDSGLRQFPVAGIYLDYSSDKGTVLIDDAVYRRYWSDRKISSVAAFLHPSANPDRVAEELRAQLGTEGLFVVQSNRGLRDAALDIFDRTFTITIALQLLAVIVAFTGVFSTLMALQLERSREIGTLRATGMSRSQMIRYILTETGVLGIWSGLLALPVGLIMALILIFVINLRSFGWTLQLHVQPVQLLEAFLVAVLAALLAGLYPAIRYGRVKPSEALRVE